MKKSIVFLVFLMAGAAAFGQWSKLATKIYDEHKYREVTAMANKLDIIFSHDDEEVVYDFAGRSYYVLGMYDSAVYFENKALALDNDASPVSGWGYIYRGMALYRLGKKEESVADLQKAITLGKTRNSVETAKEFLDNVNHNSVPDGKYDSYYLQGEYKNAIAEGRAQLAKQDYKDVMEVVGASYYDTRNYDSAIYFERKAIAADNDATLVSGWAHAYLGMALYRNNEKAKAITELTKAITLNKTSQSVRKAESFLDDIINERTLSIDSLHQAIKDELNGGDYNAAAGTAFRSVSLQPADALGWDQLATAFCLLHNYDSSLYCAHTAIALDKDMTLIACEAHYHAGIDLFMKNNKDGADAEFTKAINDHTSENLRKKVKRTRVLMVLNDTYSNWKTVERDNLVFHFQGRRNVDDDLMEKYENEYDKAVRVLPTTLPKKIEVFVWETQAIDDYQDATDKDLAYTATDFCVIHVAPNNHRSGQVLSILAHWQQK